MRKLKSDGANELPWQPSFHPDEISHDSVNPTEILVRGQVKLGHKGQKGNEIGVPDLPSTGDAQTEANECKATRL